jgi:two-component system cell cycle response regulator
MKSKPVSSLEPKKKILVVDDDANITAMLNAILTRANYEVIKASYSLPALFRAAKNIPDLILVDVNMPIMNGLELIEQFKGYEETRNIPIVAITGMDTPEVRESARKLGCAGFIAKPFDADLFAGQIAKYMHAH